MIGWFVTWLGRWLALGFELAGALIRGVLGGLVGGTGGGAAGGVAPQVRRAGAAEVVDLRHLVLRAGLPRSTAVFAGDDAPSTRHWVAEVGGRVVGVVTVLASPAPEGAPSPAGFQLRGMAVSPDHRGSHLGEALLLAAQRDVAAPMWCNARVGVVPFYAKYGWQAYGPTFEVEHAGAHQRMGWSPAQAR